MTYQSDNRNDNLFNHLSFAETYQRTFAIFGRHLAAFFCITLFAYAPYLVLLLTAAVYDSTNATDDEELPADKGYGFNGELGILKLGLLSELALLILIGLVAQGSMMRLAAESYIGNSPSGWSCIKKTWSRLCALFCFGVLRVLVVFASIMLFIMLPFAFFFLPLNTGSNTGSDTGSEILFLVALTGSFACIVACIVWLVYFELSMVCAMPAIIMEREMSSFGAMKRSFSLSSGRLCYLFCIYFWIWIVALMVFTACSKNPYSLLFARIVNILLLAPFFAILQTVIYLNFRVTKEDLTRETLMMELGLEQQMIECPVIATAQVVKEEPDHAEIV